MRVTDLRRNVGLWEEGRRLVLNMASQEGYYLSAWTADSEL